MDIKAWPVRMLHLLAVFFRRGARFLERQGRRIAHLAERTSGEATPSGTTDRSPGEPPAHWLEKIETSEEPVQWIRHSDEARAASPFGRSVSSFPRPPLSSRPERPSASQGTSAKGARGHDQEGAAQEALPSADAGGAGRAAAGPSDDRAGWSASGGQPRSGSDRQEGRSEATGSPSQRFASSAGPERPRFSSPGSPPRPVRLRFGAGDSEKEEALEEGGQESAAPPPPPRETGSSRSGRTEGEVRALSFPALLSETPTAPPQETGPSFGRAAPSGGHRLPDRQDSPEEDPAWARSAPPPPFKRFASREQRPSAWAAASMSSDTPGPAPSLPAMNEDLRHASDGAPAVADDTAQKDWPSAPLWPDLPDGAQIIQETAPDARRWAKWMHGWERRRRLNREQRGQLWNE